MVFFGTSTCDSHVCCNLLQGETLFLTKGPAISFTQVCWLWASPLPDVLKPAVSGLRHRHGPTENWSPKLVAVEKNGDDKDQTWVRVWFDISHALLRIIIIIIIMIISKTIQKCIKNHHHQ